MKTYLLLFLSFFGIVSYSQETKSQSNSQSITVSPKEFYPTIGIKFNLEVVSNVNLIVKNKEGKVVYEEVYENIKTSFHKLDLSTLLNDDYKLFFYANEKIIFQDEIKKNNN